MAEAAAALSDPAARVERATEATLRTYRDVRLASLLDTPRAFANSYAVSAAYDDATWRARLTTSQIWLAFVGDRPVGTVSLWHADDQPADETYLIGMWVSASVRGKGIGDLLVGAALDQARADGFARVLLDVAEENVPAQRLYERHGFARTGTTWLNPQDDGILEIGYAVPIT
ncbi:ribosomal protein S18 acetylase RimI-like enzyme [Knoellia remsis]|uniref:Ribosomal protein S18 acetylase RimI-like enzyme n=1 Tax=Knoellia remsis TaxID=407159 RepID=A0A2T0UN07_9MICO|nr:GNAT family N-acetyltransferase [Knoellia remsis]PRY59315.1 ribosomal protein S18 acetylase RimI-like enzyme [Knoellia remsis]